MSKEEFWNWFEANKDALEKFMSLKVHTNYDLYNELSDKLNNYSEFLIPELTKSETDKFVLIISCDGDIEGIPFAEKLTEGVRSFNNWEIIKYRQPGPMEAIPIGRLNLRRSSIYLDWKKNPDQKYDITFFVDAFTSKPSEYELAAILHLDHTIGEYNSMTRIGEIQIKKLGLFKSRKNLKSLDDLKTEIENSFA